MGVDTIVIEDSFSKKYTANYDLSILAGMDRFSFVISDQQSNLVALKSYAFYKSDADKDLAHKLREVHQQDELLKLPYRHIKVAVVNSDNTFIPNRLYDDKSPEAYLEKMVDKQATSKIHIDHLDTLKAKNIFLVAQNLATQIQTFFPAAAIHHVLSPLILGLKHVAGHHADRKVYVHVRDELAHIILFEAEDMLFANTFNFKSEKDFIYFVMLVYDQFKLKPEVVPLYFSGFILEDSQIYHQLYRYIRYLNHLQRPVFYNYGRKINAINEHFFYDLFSFKLCG